MKLTVTGGAGFIGSHLVKYLVEEGHEIFIIDNLSRGQMKNLKDVEKDINFFKIDIRNYSDLREAIRETEGVFHQAALTSVPESYIKKEEYQGVNIHGTENIFKIAQEFDIKVVYASSASVYGNTTTIPIIEEHSRKPINPYGSTKLEAEYLADKYSKSGTRIIGLRYFNVYGKGQNPNYAGVITKFQENIMIEKSPIIFGDGSQVRDFISVEDVCHANLAAMKSNEKNGFFNIGTGMITSIKDLTELMIRLSGKSIKPEYSSLPEGDIKLSQADIHLAANKLSWKPKVTLEGGLDKLFNSN